MIAAQSVVRKDVLPYTLAGGEPVRHYRLNTVGLRRRGVTGERYRALESAFRALREGGDRSARAPATPEIEELRAWLARALEARPRLPSAILLITFIRPAHHFRDLDRRRERAQAFVPDTAGGRPWRIDATKASISARSASLRALDLLDVDFGPALARRRRTHPIDLQPLRVQVRREIGVGLEEAQRALRLQADAARRQVGDAAPRELDACVRDVGLVGEHRRPVRVDALDRRVHERLRDVDVVDHEVEHRRRPRARAP